MNGQYYAPTGDSVQAAIHYMIHNASNSHATLIDGGAKGALVGNDIHVLETDPITIVDVTGVMEGVLESMAIIQCTAIIDTVDEGKIILIMSRYAQHSDGKMIHLRNQLEHFGCKVSDTSKHHGGWQVSILLKDTPSLYMSAMVSSISTC